jgi:hypothetical protein
VVQAREEGKKGGGEERGEDKIGERVKGEGRGVMNLRE